MERRWRRGGGSPQKKKEVDVWYDVCMCVGMVWYDVCMCVRMVGSFSAKREDRKMGV